MPAASETLPKILAVETSGFEGSIALATGTDTVDERRLTTGGRRHAQTLVREVDRLLMDHSLSPRNLDAVAVSTGPGSFTGLRVGVVFAKTLAWANKTHLIAVDTLRAIAQQINAAANEVIVISDAQRNELFVGKYKWDAATECRTACPEIRIETSESLADGVISEQSLLTGPGLTKHAAGLRDHWQLADEKLWLPRAATVAKVAAVKFAEDNFADPYTLEPLYIRRSYAEEKSASSQGANVI